SHRPSSSRVACPLRILFCPNAPPPTEIYPLSLHDALPISEKRAPRRHEVRPPTQPADDWCADRQTLWHELEHRRTAGDIAICTRSEEHTSELQSRGHLVCRLLLEKKNAPDPTRQRSMRART